MQFGFELNRIRKLVLVVQVHVLVEADSILVDHSLVEAVRILVDHSLVEVVARILVENILVNHRELVLDRNQVATVVHHRLVLEQVANYSLVDHREASAGNSVEQVPKLELVSSQMATTAFKYSQFADCSLS